MRIGVLADSHNRGMEFLLDRLAGVDELWHLGDVCASATLEPLYALGVPLRVVRGNNDFEPSWPMTLNLVRAGRKFHLVHIPYDDPPPGVEIVLHGHTHVPRDENLNGVRFLNPGSVGLANKGAPRSFALLTVEETGAVDWRVERV